GDVDLHTDAAGMPAQVVYLAPRPGDDRDRAIAIDELQRHHVGPPRLVARWRGVGRQAAKGRAGEAGEDSGGLQLIRLEAWRSSRPSAHRVSRTRQISLPLRANPVQAARI